MVVPKMKIKEAEDEGRQQPGLILAGCRLFWTKQDPVFDPLSWRLSFSEAELEMAKRGPRKYR